MSTLMWITWRRMIIMKKRRSKLVGSLEWEMRIITWIRKHPGWSIYFVIIILSIIAAWQYHDLNHRILQARNLEGHYGELYKYDKEEFKDVVSRLLDDRYNHEVILQPTLIMAHIGFIFFYIAFNIRSWVNNIQRYFRKPFEKWSDREKEEVLSRVHCEYCKGYKRAKFVEEFRKQGFEMMRLNCSSCGHEIVIRNPRWK